MPLKIARRPGKKSSNYYIRGTVVVWRDGRAERVAVDQSAQTTNRGEAEAIARQIEARLVGETIRGQPEAPTFGDVAGDYVVAGGERRFLLEDSRILDAFDRVPVDKIKQADIDREGRAAYPAAASATLRRQWHGPIAAVLRYHDENRRVKRPRDSARRTHFLRPSEAEALLTELGGWNPWVEVAGLLMVTTGARNGEVFGIDAQRDVRLDYASITLRHTKNGDERTVPIGRRLSAKLSKLPNLEEAGPLIRRADGSSYATERQQIKTTFRRSVERAGLDPKQVTPHILRHTFATWHYAVTLDVVRLMAVGGWRQMSMVQRYVKLASPALAADVRRHGFADAWEFPGNLQPEQTIIQAIL